VAIAAALNVTEPCSTGIGGDMFCLFYDAKSGKIRSLNGSGRSTANLNLEQVRSKFHVPHGSDGRIPTTSVHSVTVPGAAAGWVDCVKKFGSGKISMEQILSPAITLAEAGFPVSQIVAFSVKYFSCHILSVTDFAIVGTQ
jgi:gamma-glutamyltranspeptidase / glutathione hydrolase